MLELESLTGALGAVVRGADLAAPLPRAVLTALERALAEHLVLVFRDQHLTDVQHRDAAAQFGPLTPFEFAPPVGDATPEMHALAFDDGAAAKGSRVDEWHTDGSFMARPPMGTMLRAVVLPTTGGDTCFADMRAAFDALSPAMRSLLDGMQAEHDFTKIGYTTFDDRPDRAAHLAALREQYPVRRHPVVRTHPTSGRKLLYLNRNYTTRLVGLGERENEVLLPFLFDHVRDPFFQCRVRWQPGTVVLWDNRATQHYAVPDYRGRRVMHRVVIEGDEPY